MRYLAVPDFRAKGVADARVAPMSIAVLRPESGEKLVPAPTLLLDTRGKEFPSEACVSVEEALRTCVPPAAHPDPRTVAAAVSFMMEEELEDLATAYDGAVVDADLALLPVPPSRSPASHDDWKNFLLNALEREDARREHRSSRADLEPVETPIAPRRNVLDDASRVAAPTGAQLATALKKFFSRSSRGSSPSPSRSDMFAPFTSKDRHEAARASAERETRAPFEKRARRALAAVHAADFTAPARRDQNDEGGGDEGHPPRELPVVPVVFDALFDDARRADRTEPVALAARMGFKPVTVPSVSVEWPRDILASVAAAVQVETPEPIQLPTSDDETRATDETGYDLRDLVRGMGADDVHVGPPRHVGSVVAALDEMAARGARAAAVAVEIESTEEAVRRDESFQRAELERREHARAVLMGSGEGGGGGGRGAWGGLGGGGDGGTGPGRGEALMDVAFFVRPGGLHPRTRADDGAGTAPPPMTSPTAREANRLVALVEARPTPPSARDRGAGVIDLATTPPARGGGNERREPRPAPPTGLDFEPAISRRVAREISVEVIDDDDAEILDAADRAATERMAAQAAAKDSDMDFVDDIAYPQPSPPRPPRAAPLREVRGGGWNHGAGFHPRSRPSRNPSPPPPHPPPPPPPPPPHHHHHHHQNRQLAERDSREDDFGWRGWEDGLGRDRAIDLGRDRADEFPRVLPSSPDLSLSLRDLHPAQLADEPATEVRRVVSDWRATGWRRPSPPPHARHRRDCSRRSPGRRRASRRSTSIDLDDLDVLDDSGGFFASRLRRRSVSVSPPGRSRDGDDDRPPRRYLRATPTTTMTTGAAYPRSTATPGRSARRDRTFLDSASGFDSGRRGGGFIAPPPRASAVGWGTPEKLRGMSRRTREHEPAPRGYDVDRRGNTNRRGLDNLGFGVASRGLVGGRRERERDAGLDEFMRMTAGYRYGA